MKTMSLRFVAVLFGLVIVAASLAPTPARAQDQSRDYLKASQVVDQFIEQGLKKKNFGASEMTDDYEFVRRAYLDAVGFTPSADQIVGFVKNGNANKRELLVNTLVNSPQYIERWADVWTTMIVGRKQDRRSSGVNRATMKAWMKEALLRNKGWDQITREILTSEGTNEENGAVNFFAKYGPAQKDTTAAVSKIFLGVRISCAQCHDHKFEKWKQEDFWSLASFFGRSSQRMVRPRDRSELPYYIVKDTGGKGDLTATIDAGPKMNQKVVAKAFLDGQPIATENMQNARVELARWVTSPRNPYFAQAFVNRVWGELNGRGLYHPVDDWRDSNPPSNPELLNYLAEDFAAHQYDMKYITKALMNSKAYQLAATMTPAERVAKAKGDDKALATAKDTAETTFARARFRPMTPEQMFESVVASTGGGNEIADATTRAQLEQKRSTYLDQFVTLLDNDEGVEQTDFEGTIPQALTLMNGDLLNSRISATKGFISLLMASRLNDAARIDYIFLQAVGRIASPKEKQDLVGLMQSRAREAQTNNALGTQPAGGAAGGAPPPPGRLGAGARGQAQANLQTAVAQAERRVLEDTLWALLNSSEFMFNR